MPNKWQAVLKSFPKSKKAARLPLACCNVEYAFAVPQDKSANDPGGCYAVLRELAVEAKALSALRYANRYRRETRRIHRAL